MYDVPMIGILGELVWEVIWGVIWWVLLHLVLAPLIYIVATPVVLVAALFGSGSYGHRVRSGYRAVGDLSAQPLR